MTLFLFHFLMICQNIWKDDIADLMIEEKGKKTFTCKDYYTRYKSIKMVIENYFYLLLKLEEAHILVGKYFISRFAPFFKI